MKRISYLFFFLCLLFGTTAWAQWSEPAVYVFSMDQLAEQENCTWTDWSGSGGNLLRFAPKTEWQRLVLPGIDDAVPYDQAEYLVIELEQHNPASSILLLGFHRIGDPADESGWIKARNTTRIGILPAMRTQLIFPLSYLDAQKIFLPRFPRQLKGTLSGQRMAVNEIAQVSIRLENALAGIYPESVYIRGISLLKDLPEPLPANQKHWVDSLGQWMLKDWPDKVESLASYPERFEEALSSYGDSVRSGNLSEFYGFLDLRFDSTGFFHTHHDGSRWWFVDPHGR